ncbi:MAG: selenocysteine-specific translation elongation factor [Sedimentisphaerales bacterium]|nr:selenocysteine-specific translation elongation factor [Sedimentisphaerales bacterium]
MEARQRNITLGTAGHIDHGKTALIKLLTGCETDRLKAEKERGMSIELGFAPCVLADMEVGIVDVPGHENFIKTMVAGASGIDAGLLVVAADDGVMPQTREHLDILTLLGVERGMVALTKVDCVPPERVQTATQEVENFLIGTFLEAAPILPVSSITGEGFEDFYEALKDLVASVEPKGAEGVFRVPVERAFSAKGYGTIVAGIPVSGSVEIGDDVVLLPQGTKGRLRAIQVYGRESSRALAGQCAALNVPQWDPKAITRGNVVTVADYFSPSSWYLCELKLLEQERAGLKNAQQVKFHTGTSETTAAVYLFQETNLKPGGRCLVQVRLNEPLVAGPRDHFIVRMLSPARTIGGGIVIEALSRRLKRSHPEVVADVRTRAVAVATPGDFIEYCVKSAESFAAAEKELSLRSKTPPRQIAELLAELVTKGRVLQLGGRLYMHVDTAEQLRQRLLTIVEDFHQRRPESPGIGSEQLQIDADVRKDVFDHVLSLLLSEARLVERKGRLALPQHREQFNDAEQELLGRVEELFRNRPFNPPGVQEITDATRQVPPEVERAVRLLVEQQRLVRVDQKLYFHAEAVATARERLIAHIRENGGLESVKFKYLLDTTRKYAIPLLDYFDKIGVTRRVGYTRHLK